MYQPLNNILAWQEERSQGLRSLKAYGAYAVPLASRWAGAPACPQAAAWQRGAGRRLHRREHDLV